MAPPNSTPNDPPAAPDVRDDAMKIRVLGCSGAIARDCRTTAFLVDDDVLVDAGTGVGDLPLEDM